MEEVQLSRGKNEREIRHAELVREKLRMARPFVTARVHGRLVQRRGHDSVNFRCLRQRTRLDDESICGVTSLRADSTDGNAPQRRTGLNHLDGPRIV